MVKLLSRFVICIGLLLIDPAISMAQPPLKAYGALPGFEMAAISTSGKYVAIVGTLNGKKQLMILQGADKPFRIIGLGDVKVRDIEWAGDDYILIVIGQTEALGFGFTADKAELTQILVHGLVNNQTEWIFRKQKGIANTIIGRYGTRLLDGKWKGYFGGMSFERDVRGTGFKFSDTRETVFQIDLEKMYDRQVDQQKPGSATYSDWLLDAQGAVAAKLNYQGETGKWEIENSDGQTIVEDSNPTGGVGMIALGSNAASVFYYRSEGENEAASIYELALAGGEPALRFEDDAIDRWYIDHRTNQLMGYRKKSGSDQMVFFDPRLTKAATNIRRAFSKYNMRLEDWNEDFTKVIVSTSGNGDAGSWWLVDLTTMRAEQLGSEYPLVRIEDVGTMKMISYTAQDGLEMDGVLTLPPGREAKNLPAIMLPHGGPSAHDEIRFDWWAQAFASRGYAVFQPNFRGSTNRTASFQKAGDGEWGRKMQTDISDGMAELVKRGIIDPDRVCIMGASYGGYAALAGVTLQQGLYRCAVSVAGVSDLNLMYRDDVKISGRNKTLMRSLQAEIGKGRSLTEVSPARFADQADAPILLIHGKDDTVVLYNQSLTMADALKDAGKPFEFLGLKGEDHWLSSAATRLEMLEASMSFMLRNNPPD
jgi:dipeptidyl aminopeptidase/acylaminoacyl peptidase